MNISTDDGREAQHGRAFLIAGIVLLIVGFVLHDWTVSYLLQPEAPFRLTARIHWWYLSLNAWGVGLWLIIWRRSIRPIAVLAVAVTYAFLLALLIVFDLWRGYAAVTASDPRTVTGEYHTLDDHLGWVVKPGAEARVVREGVYDVSYKIDPDGHRRTVPAPQAGRRIFIFGDSFAFGWGVNDQETFSSRLAAREQGRTTVLNMGVEGYGVTQIYARLMQTLDDLRHDDIVIFTVIGDDVRRNWRDFVFVSRMLFGKKRIERFPVFENGALRVVSTDSIAHKLKALLVYAPWLGSAFGPLVLPRADQALADTAQMLAMARRAVESRGARFLVVQLPTGAELLRHQISFDLTTLGAFQVKDHFPKDPESLRSYFLNEDDGHYSPLAHSMLADLLHDHLRTKGWIAP